MTRSRTRTIVASGLTAVLALAASPAHATIISGPVLDETKPVNCPLSNSTDSDEVGHVTKVDAPTGEASGDFGTVTSNGTSVSYVLNPGYTVEICVKGSDASNTYTVTGSGSGLVAPTNASGGSAAVSHFSVKVTAIFRPTGTLDVSKTAAGTYENETTWAFDKSVTPTTLPATGGGAPGSVHNFTWKLESTKTVSADRNFSVTGNIEVDNNSNMTVTFSATDLLNDGTVGAVTCPTTTLAVGANTTCTYTAAPNGRTATLNTATVTPLSTTPAGHTAFLGVQAATAPVSFAETKLGDQSVELADPMLGVSKTLTGSDTTTVPGSYTCPTDAAAYDSVTRTHTKVITNLATLTGATTTLSDSATVTINCVKPEVWKGETATGRGIDWTRNSNWFMFSEFSQMSPPGGIDLVAGQTYDAGQITAVRNGTTSITITLDSGYRFAAVANNVKIQPLTSCESGQAYVEPGKYAIKRTASGSSITVTGLANTACYAIHVDVERRIS